MRRRDFISLIGGTAAAWPLAAHAQQSMPVIGFLGAPSAAPYERYVAAVHQGLKEVGYVEHQNVAMEYRWADNQNDRGYRPWRRTESLLMSAETKRPPFAGAVVFSMQISTCR
jgi:hypothetical protein